MKKCMKNGKRILAFMLAACLAFSNFADVQAATGQDADVVTEETTEEATEASEETTEAVTTEETEETTEEVVTEEVATEATEEEVPAEEPSTEEYTPDGNADGTPSTVIGVWGKKQVEVFTTAGGKMIPYVKTNAYDQVFVAGSLDSFKDAATGMYKVGNKYYAQGYEVSKDPKYSCLQCLAVPANDAQLVAQYNMYKVGNNYYTWVGNTSNDNKYVQLDQGYIYLGQYNSKEAMLVACGKYLETGASTPAYIVKGSKYYQYGDWSIKNVDNHYFYQVNNEIYLDKSKVSFQWEEVVSWEDGQVTKDGTPYSIGYEVEVNDKIYKNQNIRTTGSATHFIGTSNNVTISDLVATGASVKVRVRAIYYTSQNKTIDGQNTTVYSTYKVGEWSVPYTYKVTAGGIQLNKPTGLKVTKQADGGVMLSCKKNTSATTYQFQYILSDTKLTGLTHATWNQYSKQEVYYGTNSFKVNKTAFNGVKTQYMYVRVAVKDDYDRTLRGASEFSDIVAYTYVPKKNTPKVKKLRVEYSTSGDFTIAWKAVDADVVVFCFEEGLAPANYKLLIQKPYRYDDYGNKVYYLNEDWSLLNQLNDSVGFVCKSGKDNDSANSWEFRNYYGGSFNFDPTKKYEFVAYTYDASQSDVKRASIVNWNGNDYCYYAPISKPSKTVKAKKSLSIPSVSSMSANNSIELFFGTSSPATGVEVYRKSGSGYKKLANVTSGYYLDKGLSANQTYAYKVRSYYYNYKTKATAYSEFNYLEVETSSVNTMWLDAAKKSKNTVALKWFKVPTATKYEIYRKNMSSKDEDTCEDYHIIGNDKYQLLRTVSGSTTAMTDTTVTDGEEYNYVVRAYYKVGSKTKYIDASDSVELYLTQPSNVKGVHKGKKVKITWDKDPYAKKYQIRYKVYNIDGQCTTSGYKYVTTKKTSLTVKVGKGGYISYAIRSVGAKKVYSNWTNSTTVASLAGAKGVKAVNTEVKNASGKKVSAVKVSWNKVKGAKYYRVLRTTEKPTYNTVTKMYKAQGLDIVKEANNDENKNEVLYREYKNISGSIKGTSAYDYAHLYPGVEYFYTVVAYGEKGSIVASYFYSSNPNDKGSGSYSSLVYNTKLTLKAKAKKKKAILTWNMIEGAESYTIYRATSKNGKYVKVGTTTKTTFTNKKLKKGKTYFYKIVVNGTTPYLTEFTYTSNVVKVKIKK